MCGLGPALPSPQDCATFPSQRLLWSQGIPNLFQHLPSRTRASRWPQCQALLFSSEGRWGDGWDQPQKATGGFVRGECAPPRDGHKAHEAKAWPHPLLCFRHPWRFADLQLSSRPASSHFTAFIPSSPRPVNRRFQDRPAADKQVPRQRILRTEIHPTAVWYQRANPGTVGSGRAWPCEVSHQGYLDPITGIYSLA